MRRKIEINGKRYLIVIAYLITGIGINESKSQGVWEYATSGTYTWECPAGVTKVTVECWGGGGAGGSISNQGGYNNGGYGGGGGGGGAYSKKTSLAVIPGTTYTVVVGAGGTPTTGSRINGGDSYFMDITVLLARGGYSGPSNMYVGGNGGPSTECVGDVIWRGGMGDNGGDGYFGSTAGGGGSSAGTEIFGNPGITFQGGYAPACGGDGGNANASIYVTSNGNPGEKPGGGGGGGYRYKSGIGMGGRGADGKVLISLGIGGCSNPDVPVLGALINPVCSGSATSLFIAKGAMNGGAYWQWYSGSCGGSAAGQGDLIVVSPTVTTTYYARSEGGGIEPGNCGSIVVTVNPVPQGILTANGPFCGQGNGKLTFTETNGAPGPFTIIYNDGASDRTASNVESGIAFSAGVNPVTTTTSYTLVSVTSANNCQRTSGFTQGSATITVNPSSLSITITPQEASLCPGSSLILTATASGGNLSYQWQKNGGNISNATSSTYTLENISETDKGKYTCIASNTCGAASSNASTLEVKSEAEISNSIPNQSKCMGETALFTINATGTNLSYQWTKDGTGTPIAGATNSAFTLTNLKKSDENLYSCIVSNDCGSKSIEPFLLLIESKPTINIYPVTQTKIEGESITYVLNPLGSPPLFYQWKKNNINIPDATGDSYKVASITCGDAGNYSCEISNNCGKITTPVGTLIVNGCGIFTVSGTVIYDNKNLTPMTSTAVYIETTEGVSIDSTMTDNSGLYTFFDLPNGSYKLTCKSEKAWGGGNPVDALLINKYFIGLYNFTGILRQKAADVTNDGRINPADALQINRRFVGLINHYSLNDWLFEVPVINANGSDILQDIKAICAGDVDGSYKP